MGLILNSSSIIMQSSFSVSAVRIMHFVRIGTHYIVENLNGGRRCIKCQYKNHNKIDRRIHRTEDAV